MSRGLVFKSLLIIVFVLAAVSLRVFYLQRSHFAEAGKNYASGHLKLAIREYGSAIKLHFPFSPYTRDSALALWRIGSEFETEGKLSKAQAAFSALRSAFYATRSLYSPGKEWIGKCDERLAHIRAAMLLREGRISPEEFEATRLKHLETMRTDRAPVPLWALLSSIFFTGFLASVAYLIFRGFGPDARPRKKEALIGLLASSCTLLLWIVSLVMA